MATIDENQNFAGTEFFPFNDADPFAGISLQTFNSNGAVTSVSASRGYDTSLIDRFRQGVELRTPRHVYESVQGKIWAGNLNHFVLVRTIGQARSFTEFENTPVFDDTTRKFDPVLYIESQLYDVGYPYPIIFNDGPQQEEEASVEPLTIQFRKASTEGRHVARGIKASLEEGNNFDSEDLASSRVQQFIDFSPPNEPRFFLDEGQGYFGGVVKVNFLDQTFNPIALYPLTDLTWRDQTGNNPALQSAGVSSPVLTVGPFTNAYYHNTASLFTTANVLTSSGTPSNAILTRISTSMTMECYFKYDGETTPVQRVMFSQGGTGSNISSGLSGNNVLYSVLFSTTDNTITYFHQRNAGSAVSVAKSFAGVFRSGSWNHVAVTREVSANLATANVTIYLNGVNLGSSVVSPSTNGENTKFIIGNHSLSNSAPRWRGSLASVKIINRVLTLAEIQQEANRLLIPTYNDGAIVIDGFTPLIQREIIPYDETRDERIVNRIQTSDPEFISVLKALDFDLEGDIREDFDKKSATAGNDVYGPDAALAGTDSIAFVGRIRGT